MTSSAQASQPILRFVTDFPFTETDRERLRAALGEGGALFVAGDDLRDTLAAHPETEILCSFRPPADTYTLAPRLRWLALPSAGADIPFSRGLVRPGGPIVTNASGIHAIPMREHVFGVILLWTRGWPRLLDAQRRKEWLGNDSAWSQRELDGATLGVVGLGAIGRAVAQLGRAFGMRVVATRRHVGEHASDPDADVLLPQDRLHELLAQSDYVVLAVPSTPDTQHLIGAPELRAMRRDAFLVNIARGSVIDEQALVAALRAGEIGGAGLDVFAREPLPPASPLWELPNVLISPHVAGATDHYTQRYTELFLDNLARLRAGQPLRNVVDPVRGY